MLSLAGRKFSWLPVSRFCSVEDFQRELLRHTGGAGPWRWSKANARGSDLARDGCQTRTRQEGPHRTPAETTRNGFYARPLGKDNQESSHLASFSRATADDLCHFCRARRQTSAWATPSRHFSGLARPPPSALAHHARGAELVEGEALARRYAPSSASREGSMSFQATHPTQRDGLRREPIQELVEHAADDYSKKHWLKLLTPGPVWRFL